MVTYRSVKALLRKPYYRKIPILGYGLVFHRIRLRSNGEIHIDKGYAWDHASGAVDTDSIIEAALVHDALSELIHNGLLPKTYWNAAADIMHDIAIENGMWRIRAAWIRRAIRIAGPEVTKSREWREV